MNRNKVCNGLNFPDRKCRKETEKLWNRFFDLFSKMWNIGAIYKADKMGDKADPYSTPISALNKEEMKLFYIYCVFLFIKELEKNNEILELKPALFIIKERS